MQRSSCWTCVCGLHTESVFQNQKKHVSESCNGKNPQWQTSKHLLPHLRVPAVESHLQDKQATSQLRSKKAWTCCARLHVKSHFNAAVFNHDRNQSTSPRPTTSGSASRSWTLGSSSSPSSGPGASLFSALCSPRSAASRASWNYCALNEKQTTKKWNRFSLASDHCVWMTKSKALAKHPPCFELRWSIFHFEASQLHHPQWVEQLPAPNQALQPDSITLASDRFIW